MRKLVHEEVGKEAVDKSINIAVRLSKPTLKEFMKALKFAVGKPTKAVGKAIGEKIHPTKGKQSVKTLIRQGQGVSSIPLADEGLKDFQKIAKKYGINTNCIHPHSFRHMYAKSFLDKRSDVTTLSDILGHESIKTTQIYLRRSYIEQKRIIDKIVTW